MVKRLYNTFNLPLTCRKLQLKIELHRIMQATILFPEFSKCWRYGFPSRERSYPRNNAMNVRCPVGVRTLETLEQRTFTVRGSVDLGEWFLWKRFQKELIQRNGPPRFEEKAASEKDKTATKKKIKLKNLDKQIFFLTDGNFDFTDQLWKSGKTTIRRVNDLLLT